MPTKAIYKGKRKRMMTTATDEEDSRFYNMGDLYPLQVNFNPRLAATVNCRRILGGLGPGAPCDKAQAGRADDIHRHLA